MGFLLSTMRKLSRFARSFEGAVTADSAMQTGGLGGSTENAAAVKQMLDDAERATGGGDGPNGDRE